MDKIMLCDYGCGQEAKYPFKNRKWCCSSNISGCPFINEKQRKAATGRIVSKETRLKMGKSHTDPSEETRRKMSIARQGKRNPFYGKKHTDEAKKIIGGFSRGRISYMKGKLHSRKTKEKISKALKGQKRTNETCKKISKSLKGKQSNSKFTVKKLKKRYPFFFIIEDLQDDFKNRSIQGRCKNHNCKNSKEKGGWFTLTYIQLYERIRALESIEGSGGSYFYCCQECKDTCPLYNLKSDPLKDNNLPYTPGEYQTFRTFVLERDDHNCQFCGKKATDVHHEHPQKLEPFYALDPDFAWSCCEKCHYEKGHRGECSTGNLSKIVCSVESQKFLNQKEEKKYEMRINSRS